MLHNFCYKESCILCVVEMLKKRYNKRENKK